MYRVSRESVYNVWLECLVCLRCLQCQRVLRVQQFSSVDSVSGLYIPHAAISCTNCGYSCGARTRSNFRLGARRHWLCQIHVGQSAKLIWQRRQSPCQQACRSCSAKTFVSVAVGASSRRPRGSKLDDTAGSLSAKLSWQRSAKSWDTVLHANVGRTWMTASGLKRTPFRIGARSCALNR